MPSLVATTYALALKPCMSMHYVRTKISVKSTSSMKGVYLQSSKKCYGLAIYNIHLGPPLPIIKCCFGQNPNKIKSFKAPPGASIGWFV